MTKEQLKSYRRIRLEYDELNALIKELEARVYNPRTVHMHNLTRGGDGSGKPTEVSVLQHDELIDKYTQKAEELEKAMLQCEDSIKFLDPTERTLIRLYYIKGMTWEQVAVNMNYSWRQIHRIHGKALEKIRDK